MEEWHAEYSHPAMAINQRDHDQRAEHRHYDGSLTTRTVSTLLYARQASTKRRESNGSDVQ